MGNEYEVTVILFLKILTDQILLLRLKVKRIAELSVVFLSDTLFGLIKADTRNLVNLRKCDSKDLQLFCVAALKKLHCVLQESGFHRHNVLKSINVAHLKIQTGILI